MRSHRGNSSLRQGRPLQAVDSPPLQCDTVRGPNPVCGSQPRQPEPKVNGHLSPGGWPAPEGGGARPTPHRVERRCRKGALNHTPPRAHHAPWRPHGARLADMVRKTRHSGSRIPGPRGPNGLEQPDWRGAAFGDCLESGWGAAMRPTPTKRRNLVT